MIFSLRCLVYTMVFLAWPALAAFSVPLAWNPSVDSTVAGYKIYYGTASHVYANSVDVGNVTKSSITGLSKNTTYYFAATTYDIYGNESDFSNETKSGETKAGGSKSGGTVVGPPVVVVDPTLDPIGNFTVSYKTTTTIILGGITSGGPAGTKLKITAISSDPKLVANPKAKVSISQGLPGSLTIKPAANTNVTVTITVTLNNGALSSSITH